MAMKISDLIFRYPTGSISRRDGICRVRTFVGANGKVFALLTDLREMNTSSSVTNSIEDICDSLVKTGIVPEGTSFIEHYEASDFSVAEFDLVSFGNSGSPHWDPIKQVDVELSLDCDSIELQTPTLKHGRLLSEIEKIRNEIDPFIDSPEIESPEVINRRAEIKSRMISRKAIADLVEAGAKEQELQRLLKADLSVFAEMYANPKDEYICFSEFPIADGVVDFAVFSGTSRMDVILIEVKGANFFLVNRGSYEKFASKMEEAADQIRKRLGCIFRNIEEFRRGVHKIRENVESGKSMHNSFLGPYGNLQVDPNKDINIRCVIIGGRSRDDLKESKKRHDYEYTFSPPIKIESWDSWARKIRRQ